LFDLPNWLTQTGLSFQNKSYERLEITIKSLVYEKEPAVAKTYVTDEITVSPNKNIRTWGRRLKSGIRYDLLARWR
jgi:hypothetical protein